MAVRFERWLKYEKSWITAFNHVWDQNLDIRCIADGAYVHTDKNEDFFYTMCGKCGHKKSLRWDDGRYVDPQQARDYIAKFKQKP